MTVYVTQYHIDRGLRRSCTSCPVALAMKDATDKVYSVTFIGIFPPQFVGGFNTPPNVMRFIHLFDMGMKVLPFEFEIPDVP